MDVIYLGDRRVKHQGTGEWATVDLCVLGADGQPLLRAFIRPDGHLADYADLSLFERQVLRGAPDWAAFTPRLTEVIADARRIVGLGHVHLDLSEAIQRIIPCEAVAVRWGLHLEYNEGAAYAPGWKAAAAEAIHLLRGAVPPQPFLWDAHHRALAARAASCFLDREGVPLHWTNREKLIRLPS